MSRFYVGWECPDCRRSIHPHTGPFGNFCPRCMKCAECAEYELVTDTYCKPCMPKDQGRALEMMMGVPRRVDGNTAWDTWEASKI